MKVNYIDQRVVLTKHPLKSMEIINGPEISMNAFLTAREHGRTLRAVEFLKAYEMMHWLGLPNLTSISRVRDRVIVIICFTVHIVS